MYQIGSHHLAEELLQQDTRMFKKIDISELNITEHRWTASKRQGKSYTSMYIVIPCFICCLSHYIVHVSPNVLVMI